MLAIAGVALPVCANAQQLVIYNLSAGRSAERIFGLSADGHSWGGTNYDAISLAGYRASATSRQDFGTSPGTPPDTSGFAISGDGSVVVGRYGASASGYSSYRWSNGQFTLLPIQPGFGGSGALGVNGDGSVVVGKSYRDNWDGDSEPFRWTAATGLQSLGRLSPTSSVGAATAVSRDGQTIVGYSGTFIPRAFSWTEETGMQELQSLPNSENSGSAAYAVNHDGSIAVGYSGPSPVFALWRNGQIQSFAPPPGMGTGIAFALSDDGSVIGGRHNDPNGRETATIWTAQYGSERMTDYLAHFGVTVPAPYRLERITGISADGLTIAGYTAFPNGRGWTFTVPSPATLPVLAALSLSLRRRVARAWAPLLGCPHLCLQRCGECPLSLTIHVLSASYEPRTGVRGSHADQLEARRFICWVPVPVSVKQ